MKQILRKEERKPSLPEILLDPVPRLSPQSFSPQQSHLWPPQPSRSDSRPQHNLPAVELGTSQS